MIELIKSIPVMVVIAILLIWAEKMDKRRWGNE